MLRCRLIIRDKMTYTLSINKSVWSEMTGYKVYHDGTNFRSVYRLYENEIIFTKLILIAHNYLLLYCISNMPINRKY